LKPFVLLAVVNSENCRKDCDMIPGNDAPGVYFNEKKRR